MALHVPLSSTSTRFTCVSGGKSYTVSPGSSELES